MSQRRFVPLTLLLGTSLASVAAVPGAAARVWHVPADAPGVQAGIDSAAVGDTVLVAPGAYLETLTLASGVALLSSEGPEATTLDGDEGGSTVTIGAVDHVVVAGFTVTNGVTLDPDPGGGFRIHDSNHVLLRGNRIVDNVSGSHGGGVYVLDCDSVRIEENDIRENQANGSGAGIAIYASLTKDPRRTYLSDNRIEHNTITFQEPSFEENISGGGIYIGQNCYADVRGNVVARNIGNGQIFNLGGGGIFCEATSSILVNNTIVNNGYPPTGIGRTSQAAHAQGAGVFLYWSNALMVNNIVGRVSHVLLDFGTCIACDGIAKPEFYHNCAWISPQQPCPTIPCWSPYSIICGPRPEFGDPNGNLAENPLLCDPADEDYHLREGSPCIGTGIDPDSVYTGGTGPVPYDMGALPVGCPPFRLALGVLQNPVLTRFLDLYLVGSQPVDTVGLSLTIGADTLALRRSEVDRTVWMADRELTGSGTISLEGCVVDPSSVPTCRTLEFTATLLRAGERGTVESADGRFQAELEAGSVEGDLYALVLPVEAAVPAERAGAWAAASRWPLRAGRAQGEAAIASYTLLPRGLTPRRPARLVFHYDAGELPPGVAPEALVIADGEGRELDSVVDAGRGTVTAFAPGFGTWRLVVGLPDPSRLLDGGTAVLAAPAPNPFRDLTTISFRLPQRERVTLAVYDVAGREVARLRDGMLEAGAHELRWNGHGADGVRLTAGVYWLRLEAGEASVTRKVTLAP